MAGRPYTVAATATQRYADAFIITLATSLRPFQTPHRWLTTTILLQVATAQVQSFMRCFSCTSFSNAPTDAPSIFCAVSTLSPQVSAGLKIIEEMQRHGCDLNTRTRRGPGAHNEGWTALHMAAAYDFLPIPTYSPRPLSTFAFSLLVMQLRHGARPSFGTCTLTRHCLFHHF